MPDRRLIFAYRRFELSALAVALAGNIGPEHVTRELARHRRRFECPS